MVRQSLSRYPGQSGNSSVRSHRPASSSIVSSSASGSSSPKFHHGTLSIINSRNRDEEAANISQCSSPMSRCLSTTSSEDSRGYPGFDLPADEHEVYGSDALPSSPAEFDASFPSRRRLRIHHDDATSDGNMNLRVDIDSSDRHGRPQKLILFHLRMQDIKARKFSLRRYSRDSGREICHTSCNMSFSTSTELAETGMLSPIGQALRQLRDRQEYHSHSNRRPQRRSPPDLQPAETDPRNITVQFSNYSQIDLEKRGSKATQRYEYEFWGSNYRWQRQIIQMGQRKAVSFHLVSGTSSRSIAHITPDYLTEAESQEEQYMGSWVPPCTLQIVDKKVFRGLTDVAEYVTRVSEYLLD